MIYFKIDKILNKKIFQLKNNKKKKLQLFLGFLIDAKIIIIDLDEFNLSVDK